MILFRERWSLNCFSICAIYYLRLECRIELSSKQLINLISDNGVGMLKRNFWINTIKEFERKYYLVGESST